MPPASTRLAGIIGWPVAHSRSPLIHRHWLAAHGIDGAYLPLPVRPGNLETALRGLAAAGFAGANVTLPYKEEAFRLCDRADADAHAARAVNTVVFHADGTIAGTCTDGAGFIASLRDAGIDPRAGPALLLGAGGAARAIAAALAGLGTPVTLANRTPGRARSLVSDIPGCATLPWEARHAALADTALLVNTTSLGMPGQPALDLSLADAPPTLMVADIVYTPLITPLLAEADARGLRHAGGLGMLIEQARPGFAAWFGTLPVVTPALIEALMADLAPAPA